MSASMVPAPGPLSFRRVVDIPFETFLAALDSWQRTGQGELRSAGSQLLGPVEHDRDTGTCRIRVGLARGPLRPLLRMRLDIDRWSSPPPQTALELTPCRYIRPSAAYFRAGHLLLDSLVLALAQYLPTQHVNRVTVSQPPTDQGQPGAWVGSRRASSPGVLRASA